MKRKLVQLILMITAGVALVVISVLAYSAAWFQADVSHPYTFDILADGVVYVYVDAKVVESENALVPAVAMPGAISEGLPYDVLKTHDEDSNSYISKAATITPIVGDFWVQNEGYGYEPIPLDHDPETGATLYPKITLNGSVVWIDDNNHSLGYETMICYQVNTFGSFIYDGNDQPIPITEDDYAPKIGEDGKIVWKESCNYSATPVGGAWIYHYDDSYYVCSSQVLSKDKDGMYQFPLCDNYGNIIWKDSEDHSQGYLTTTFSEEGFSITTGTQYEPLLDDNGNIQWIKPMTFENDSLFYMSSELYEVAERPRAEVNEAYVNFHIKFKASDNPEVDDYFAPEDFVIKKLYFVTRLGESEEHMPDQYKNGVGDRVRQYSEISDDNKSGKFTLYGSEWFWVYAEVYLAQPDELLDPVLRNADHLYMTVQVSVVIEQYVEP